MVKMRKKLISITLVLMIILTTAVATYGMESVTEAAGSADFVASETQYGYIPDGIAHTLEEKFDQLTEAMSADGKTEAAVSEEEAYFVANAGQSVTVTFLNRNIEVNGEEIINYQSDYPYFVYNTIIYVPITWENCRIFGYEKQVDENGNSLLIQSIPSQTNYAERWVKNTEDVMNATISGKKVTIRKQTADGNYDDILLTSDVTQGFPILEYNGAVYIPLTYNVVTQVLCWGKEYDNYSGLYLNTLGVSDAASMVDTQTSAYNRALVNYIRSVNGSVTEQEAVEMVFLVKQKAQIYGVDERLILAMIQKESTFYDDVNGSGAIGLMQIIPSTGKMLGATPAQLEDPSINVELGTKYIAQHISTFGNISQALVAYNAGSNVARSGKTSSSYSNTVLQYYNNMVSATSV